MNSKNLSGIIKPPQKFVVSNTFTLAPDVVANVTMTSTTTVDGYSMNYLTFYIPKGSTGSIGATGSQGNAGTISIGTVTTVPTTTPASITNVGTSSAAIWNISLPKGETGPQGSNADNYVMMGLLIGAITGSALSLMSSLLNNLLDSIMDALGLGNRPNPTNEDRIEALGRLITQMKQEIDVLQAEMDTVQSQVATLESQMGYVEEKVQFQNTYTDIYLNSITNFNSAITTTDGIFGETSRINKSGGATFSSLKTSTLNTPYGSLRINGNVSINGTLIHKNVNGGYSVSNGQWDF